MRDATLVAARMLSANTRELTIDPGPDFRFVPGQWVNLFLPAASGDEPLKRPYSIASAPREDGCFDLAVTLVPGGPGSSQLHAAAIGSTLKMSHAQGFFTLDPIVRPVLMVATGTGVAPFRAILQSLVVDPPSEPCVLVFGNRTEADILYRDELESIATRCPWFRFLPTLSRAEERWQGKRGYVQLHLDDALEIVGTDCDAYVCGLTKMVHDVRRILREEHQLERKRVHIERYD